MVTIGDRMRILWREVEELWRSCGVAVSRIPEAFDRRITQSRPRYPGFVAPPSRRRLAVSEDQVVVATFYLPEPPRDPTRPTSMYVRLRSDLTTGVFATSPVSPGTASGSLRRSSDGAATPVLAKKIALGE